MSDGIPLSLTNPPEPKHTFIGSVSGVTAPESTFGTDTGGSITVNCFMAVAEPHSLVTVSFIVKVPAVLYVCVTVVPVAVIPPPKSQLFVRIVPVGHELSLKVTWLPLQIVLSLIIKSAFGGFRKVGKKALFKGIASPWL